MPQPYLVPVRPTCSRSTHSNGVLGSTSTSWAFPLTVKRAMNLSSLRVRCRRATRCGGLVLRFWSAIKTDSKSTIRARQNSGWNPYHSPYPGSEGTGPRGTTRVPERPAALADATTAAVAHGCGDAGRALLDDREAIREER